MFHVGQLVICIKDTSSVAAAYPDYIMPQKGFVYTVRQVHFDCEGIDSNNLGTGILLFEIHNKPFDEGGEPAFDALSFRPIDEARIDRFRQMLVTPPREPAHADLTGDERAKVMGWEAG
jgi:hypothetical protein